MDRDSFSTVISLSTIKRGTLHLLSERCCVGRGRRESRLRDQHGWSSVAGGMGSHCRYNCFWFLSPLRFRGRAWWFQWVTLRSSSVVVKSPGWQSGTLPWDLNLKRIHERFDRIFVFFFVCHYFKQMFRRNSFLHFLYSYNLCCTLLT